MEYKELQEYLIDCVLNDDNSDDLMRGINQVFEKVERYEKALKEIAEETGTPYADIAIVALNSGRRP